MPGSKLDFAAVLAIATKLGATKESTIHGAPSIRVGGKLFACPALHKSADPDSFVLRIDSRERDRLIAEDPDTYYLTNHYANYPMVLVRPSQLNRKSLEDLLKLAWRFANAKTDKAVRKSVPKSAARK